jgi:hypothetical protein
VRIQIHGLEVVGFVAENFTLYTNDPKHPQVTLRLSANVQTVPEYIKLIGNANPINGELIGAFRAWPTAKPALKIQRNTSAKFSIRIRASNQEAVDLKMLSDNFEQAKYKLRREENGNTYWVDIETEPVAEAGERNIKIDFQSVSPVAENFSIIVALQILDDSILFTPAVVNCGEIPLSSLKQLATRVGRAGIRKLSGTFHIKTLSATLDFLKVNSQTMVEGSNYLLTIDTEPAKLPKAGTYEGKIIVETDDVAKPRVEIPIKIILTDK